MHPKKRADKPQAYLNTPPLSPITKCNTCPVCGEPKRSIANLCKRCFMQAKRPPESNQTVYMDGKPARRVPIIHGGYAIVDAENYDWIIKIPWRLRQARTDAPSYAITTIDRRNVGMHRMIVKAPSNKFVDHINGNGLDNRESNLRICNRRQNGWNRRINKNNTSGYRGVSWHKRQRKWAASIHLKGKGIAIGYYTTAECAARAYDKIALKHRGRKFQRFNFPDIIDQLPD